MFKKLFNSNKLSSPTGCFEVIDGRYVPMEILPKNGSINSIVEYLGYAASQVRTIFTVESNKITCVGVLYFTKQLKFIMTESKGTILTESDINDAIKNIDWNFEYSPSNIEDIFSEGIADRGFSFDFLNSVLNLSDEGNGIFLSSQHDLYLTFENNYLISFSSSSWASAETKWLMEINPQMVEDMKNEANEYQNSEIDVMQEVNRQIQSLRNIPDATNNEFVNFHTKKSGNVNYFNIYIAHYNRECSLEDFIFMNKGRITAVSPASFETEKFRFTFSSAGELDNIELKK